MDHRLPIKKLVVAKMSERFPDFVFVEEGKPGYWFRRPPRPILYSFIVVQVSQKYSCCEVDVAASFESMWDKLYGTHHLRRSTGLPNLREGSNAIHMELVPYKFDQTEIGFQACLDRISQELFAYAVPYFDNAENVLRADPLFIFSLQWVKQNLNRVPEDFESQWFVPVKDRRNRTPIPILEELKTAIRLEASRLAATKEERKQTGILALDLLRYASTRLLSSG